MTKLFFLLFVIFSSLLAASPLVVKLDINGVIGPASSSFLKNGIEMATRQNAQMILVKLDTTGGLSTSMQEMVQDITKAKIPVIMYAYTKNDASANIGTYLMYASNIGAIDLTTDNTRALLQTLDGKNVKMSGKSVVLSTKNAHIINYQADWKTKFLYIITNPNIIYILLLITLYGIFFEFISPGGIFPGVIGSICGVVVLYALNLLPFNYAGLLLIIMGVGFMIAEIFISGFGILGIGGVISFALGSFLLFDAKTLGESVSVSLIIALTLVSIAFFILVIRMFLRARAKKVITGIENLIGSKGSVIDENEQSYRILCQGEIWNAKSTIKLTPKQEVEVVGLHGLTLDVKPIKE